MGRKKQKLVLPPELPPEVPDDEIVVSDEDLQFVNENLEYAGFVSNLDTHSITKHVTRMANVNEDALESLYEKRLSKKLENKETEQTTLEVDPVDALPVKTLDGQLYYRRVAKVPKLAEDESKEGESGSKDPSLVKLTKAEKRAKNKKLRKEAKKQAKEEVQQTPQAEVLAEVEKDLTAEEAIEKKKSRLAELAEELLADPESNIKHIKEMLEISKVSDSALVILALKSLMLVFKDIIPGYRIRLPTEKEQEMKVSKATKKMRFYESTLLSAYKTYVQKLVVLQKQTIYKRAAVRCLCDLLTAVPHFNFYESLLSAVVKNISSEDDVIRGLCCSTIRSLFIDEGKHGGVATVEAVRMIADLVKEHNCLLHPDSVEVLLLLSFDEDLRKTERPEVDGKAKNKKFRKGNVLKAPNHVPENEKKKSQKEMSSRIREEVTADLKAASLAQDPQERKMQQSETLSAVFQIFFRVLKHAIQPKSEYNSKPATMGSHPLLSPCLKGIGKFSHLLDMDFMADLMQCLRKLAGSGSKSDDSSEGSNSLTVSERLRCCIVAFKVMRGNLDALNVDLQEFFVQFYNLIQEYRPGRDQGDVLAEALKVMLCDDRQHDMQRAAAFIKRLSTFSLCFGTAESMAALVTVKHLLQKHAKCRNLLENDAGGGSVACTIAKYQPHATDPNLSGALSSVLWELNLLTKHYHPSVSSVAASISTMGTSDPVLHSQVSPQQAYAELWKENITLPPSVDTKKLRTKRKGRTNSFPLTTDSDIGLTDKTDENEVRKKFAQHFLLLHDIKENERLRRELERTSSNLSLYEQYRQQKKRKIK